MSKFKVGDRVAVYSGERTTGVVGVISGNKLKVDFTAGAGQHFWQWVHKKQCRRLVKKPRRRIWVHHAETENFFTTQEPVSDIKHEFTEFVEVRRKK